MMSIVRVIKHELKEAIVPMVFFFAVFHIMAAMKMLMLEEYNVTPTGVAVGTVLAFTMAKAVLIVDKLRFTNLFAGKPIIISVLWKTVIYSVFCFVFRFIEELIPLVSKHNGFGTAVERVFSEISWPHFWALQIWLVIALILYSSIGELDKYLGTGTIKKAFIGR